MEQQQNIWHFIINPVAGSKSVARKWPSIEQDLKAANIAYIVSRSTHSGHATQLAIEAIQAGYRKIIAVGGDGTNNEVINGIMQQKIVPSNEIIYTLLPIGTGNDWVRTHKIPHKISPWIAMLKAEKITIQDIGLATYTNEGQTQKRYFTNIAGLAYDGYLVSFQQGRETKFPTKLLYLYLTVICLFKYRLRKARITFNDKIIEDYFYTINVGICQYAGGGMHIVPHANPSDGLFGLTIAGALSKFKVITNIHHLFSGKINKVDKITTHQTKHIKIEALENEPTLLEADGEFLGQTPVEINIINKALQIVIP